MSDFEYWSKLLRLDPDTGFLYWKVGGRGRGVGKKAGGYDGSKYYRLCNHGRFYYIHRLVWLLHTGDWPVNEIDHINRDSLDNRPCNLRDATRSVNCLNASLRRDNTSGHKGIDRMESGNFRVRKSGKQIGTFPSLTLAIAAYEELQHEQELR